MEELSVEQIDQVWIDFKEDQSNQLLRKKLIEHYLPVVRYNALRLRQRLPEQVEVGDLISAGVLGLINAIEAFDLERGIKFETYCVQRVRGAMLDELRDTDWVPRLVRSKASKVEAARNDVQEEFGRPPTYEEVADRLGMPIEGFEKLEKEAVATRVLSLNRKIFETDSFKAVCVSERIDDAKSESPDSQIQKRDLMKLVTKGLNRNERLIVILYYYEDLSMKEIGQTIGLSESRVSQMHSSIVQRLQEQLGNRRTEFAV